MLLPKNLSRKIARFLVSKIGPATGVRALKIFWECKGLVEILQSCIEIVLGSFEWIYAEYIYAKCEICVYSKSIYANEHLCVYTEWICANKYICIHSEWIYADEYICLYPGRIYASEHIYIHAKWKCANKYMHIFILNICKRMFAYIHSEYMHVNMYLHTFRMNMYKLFILLQGCIAFVLGPWEWKYAHIFNTQGYIYTYLYLQWFM